METEFSRLIQNARIGKFPLCLCDNFQYPVRHLAAQQSAGCFGQQLSGRSEQLAECFSRRFSRRFHCSGNHAPSKIGAFVEYRIPLFIKSHARVAVTFQTSLPGADGGKRKRSDVHPRKFLRRVFCRFLDSFCRHGFCRFLQPLFRQHFYSGG